MAERWDAPTVSAGDMLRAEIADGTEIGKEAARHMDHGRLVPDNVALASIESWLAAHRGAFVFDGFPRTLGQAEALDTLLARRQSPLTAVLWLELPLAQIEERVSRRVVCQRCGRSFQVGVQVQSRQEACPVCGGELTVRSDDNSAMLTNRMEQYREHTQPVMDHYGKRGLLRRIDAGGTPEEVFARIEAATGAAVNLEVPA